MNLIDAIIQGIDFYQKVSNIVKDIEDQLFGNESNSDEVLAATSEVSSETVATQIIKTSDTQTANTEKAVDPGVRLQVDPDTETKIPVLYGRGAMGGKVVDAALVNNNTELQVCLTLTMFTGNKINGDPSNYTVNAVYMDGNRLAFAADGITVASATDPDGGVNTDIANKVAVYLFRSSNTQLEITGYPLSTSYDARNIFANWTTTNLMSGQIFAIVRIAYDPYVGLNRFPGFTFDITNDMSLPGDCLYDYLTNTVYGCGISPDLIKATSL